MNIPETASVIRLYHNGDGPGSGLKFFVSTRQARALGLRPGDLFDLRAAMRGTLELVPAKIHVQLAAGEAPILDHLDPFTAVWRRRGDGAPDFHRIQDCPILLGALKLGHNQAYATRLASAQAGGSQPCGDCWTPPAPEAAS